MQRLINKVQKLAERDMEIALKTRQKFAHKRKTERGKKKNKNDKLFERKKRHKSPYKDVKSKIKSSVLKDKSK